MTAPLVLEVNEAFDKDNGGRTGDLGNGILVTPAISADYWVYRVRLSAEQAILGFPKFSTVGIGFEKEEDWNTNLPFTSNASDIYNHIEHNKGDDSITREQCIEAIGLIREAARRYKGLDDETWQSEQDRANDFSKRLRA